MLTTPPSPLPAVDPPALKPINQNAARYYRRVAVDLQYGGIADDTAEGARLAAALGGHRVLMMGNHGVLVIAPTVAEAFEELYFLERACRTLVLAYSTGQPLNVMPHELAEQTAKNWEAYSGMAFAHFEELKRTLELKDGSFRQ